MTRLPPVGLLRPADPRQPRRQVISATPRYVVYAETPGHAVTTRTPRFIAWMRDAGVVT